MPKAPYDHHPWQEGPLLRVPAPDHPRLRRLITTPLDAMTQVDNIHGLIN
jgi:hypothetical protein